MGIDAQPHFSLNTLLKNSTVDQPQASRLGLVVMAEENPDQALQGVKEYQYFQPELIKLIASENIYDEDENGGGHPPWEIDE